MLKARVPRTHTPEREKAGPAEAWRPRLGPLLVFALALCILAYSASAAVTFKSAVGANVSVANNTVITPGTSVAVGDTIIVGTGKNAAGATMWVTSVTDTIGNTYTRRARNTTTSINAELWYCLSSTGASSSNKVTVVWNGTAAGAVATQGVYSLVASIGAFNSSTATAAQHPISITTTGAGSMAVANIVTNSTTTHTSARGNKRVTNTTDLALTTNDLTISLVDNSSAGSGQVDLMNVTTATTSRLDYRQAVELKADTTNPGVSQLSKSPADISSTNVIGANNKLNITYNMTDNLAIDNATANLTYKTNTTSSDVNFYVNGTAISGWRTTNATSVSGSNRTFVLDDNDIYPATYNLNEDPLEATAHSAISLTGQNTYYKIRLYNVSASKTYSFLEVMAHNQSASSTPLIVYYCNSSYSTGDPLASASCTSVYSILATMAVNHTHSANSDHYVVPVAIASSKVGSVTVTDPSYFLLRTTSGSNGWNVYYVSDISRADTIRYTTNKGGSWSSFAGTIDAHLHQYDGTETFRWYACANDTSANQNCTAAQGDLINLGGLPPSAPDVYAPTEGVYTGSVTISYGAAASPNGYAIDHYNISLLNSDYSFNKTINASLTALTYSWDSAGSAGQFVVRVRAYDNNSLYADGFSQNFTINSPPTVSGMVLNSTSGANSTSDNLTAYYTVSDADGDATTNITDWRVNGASIATLNLPFDSNASTNVAKDYSTFGNNGTIYGASYAAGKFGKALSFGGSSDYVDAGTSSALNPTDAMSIEAWVYPNDATNFQAVVARDVESGRSYELTMNWPTVGAFGMYFHFSDNSDGYVGGNVSAPVGNWYHVVLTYDKADGNARLYQDGVLIGVVQSASGIAASSGTATTIGRRLYSGYGWFNGKIDGVRVYNRSLSTQQVSALYNGRNDLVVSQELRAGENWSVAVTPNDGQVDGNAALSGNVTINGPLSPLKIAALRIFESESTSQIGDGTSVCDLDSTYGNNVAPAACSGYVSAKNSYRTEIRMCNDQSAGGSSVYFTSLRHKNITGFVGSFGSCGHGDSSISTITCDYNSTLTDAVTMAGAGVVLDASGVRNDSSCEWFAYWFNATTTLETPTVTTAIDTVGASEGDNPSSTGLEVQLSELVAVQLKAGFGTIDFGNVDFSHTYSTESGTTTAYQQGSLGSGTFVNTTLQGTSNVTLDKSPAGVNGSEQVAYWKFNNDTAYGESGTNAYDYTGHGKNGTISGATYADGQFGKALSFDGSDYVDAGNSNAFDLTSAFSVEAWVKLASAQPSSSCWAIVAKGYSNSAGNVPYTLWHCYAWGPVDATRYGFTFGGYLPGWVVAGSTSSSSLASAGNWYHVIGTYNGTNFKVYVNGTLISTSATGSVPTNANPVYIAAYYENGAANYKFNGVIDNVVVYNRTLSDSEVLSRYNNGTSYLRTGTYSETYDAGEQRDWSMFNWTTPVAYRQEAAVETGANGMLAYMKFNNDSAYGESGSLAYDYSGSGRNGTIYSATYVTGMFGKALDFHGNSRVPLASQISPGDSQNFSFAMWVNFHNFSSPGSEQMLVDRVEGGASILEVRTLYSSGANSDIYFRIRDKNNGGLTQVGATNGVTTDKWHYIVAERDGSAHKIRIYIDGVLKNTASETTSAGFQHTPLIGTHASLGAGYYTNSTIDSFIIYNRALTAEEILDQYKAGVLNITMRVDTSADNTSWSTESAALSSTDKVNVGLRFNDYAAYGENATSASDFSGNNNTATIVGSAAYEESPFGKSLKLDGSSAYVSIPNNPTVAFASDMTIDLWLKPGSAQVQYADILSRHSNGYVIEQNGGATNQYVFGWYTPGVNWNCLGTTFSLTADRWQHLVISKSGATAYYYIDGSLVTSCTGTAGAAIADPGIPLELGSWTTGGGRYWNGSFDQVAIFNRSLSTEEIQGNYNKSIARLQPVQSNASSGIQINNTVDPNARFFRYTASFSTENTTYTPVIQGASFGYQTTAQPYEDITHTTGSDFAAGNRTNTTVSGAGDDANVTLSGGGPPEVNASEMVGYWKLDNNAAYGESGTLAYDYTGNGNNATCSGGTCPSYAAGKFDNAATFDGGDYLNAANENNFDVSGDMTVAGWFKTTNTALSFIFGKHQCGNTNGYFITFNDGGTGRAAAYHSGTYIYGTNSGFNDGNWHYAVEVKNSTHVMLYIDGQREAMGAVGGYVANGVPFEIATVSNGACGYGYSSFTGSIDNVIFYNRALSADEVSALYDQGNAASPSTGTFENIMDAGETAKWTSFNWSTPIAYQQETPVESGLTGMKGYWKFNNASAYGENDTRAYDYSGNGNNCTISSGPTYSTGKLGKGMEFFGVANQNLTCGSDSSLDPSTNLTIVLWLKLKSLGASFPANSAHLVSKSDSGGYRWLMAFCGDYSSGRRICFYTPALGDWVNATTEVPLNEWTQLAVTYDASALKFYFNGQLDETRSGGTINTGGTLILGNRHEGSLPLNGTLDQVMIYNRTLSSNEIRDIYEAGALNLTMEVATSDDNETWSDWSGPYYANQSSGASLGSPQTRYLKYRASFSTENSLYSPILEAVTARASFRPEPFVVENVGTVAANVTISASDFFSSSPNPSANYWYKVSAYEPGSIGVCSATEWTQMPDSETQSLAVCSLGTSESANEARVDIKITVPAGEPGGQKTSAVTFTASQA